MNNFNDIKIQQECLHTANGEKLLGPANEDRWFREHEEELLKAARAQRTGDEKAGECSHGCCTPSRT